jgi:isocitrate dehydrogenase
MSQFKKINIPNNGSRIRVDENGNFNVPNNPIIPFIEGDGTGPELTKAMQGVINKGVKQAYKGEKKIAWMEIYAGEKAVKKYGRNQYLPTETVNAIEEYIIAIKGPLTTPVGGGFKSLNVTLRQKLDLFACIRPVKYYQGTPSPLKHPQNLDVVVIRENTEDLYSGIEFKANSIDAKELVKTLKDRYNMEVREDSGLGIKVISEFNSDRLVKKAIEYAIENNRKSITLMHKGNIMKYTEGAFKDWGYKAAKKYFGDKTITEEDLLINYGGELPGGKILIKDRIADSVFQQILLRPEEFDIIAAPYLNGDYLADAAAAQIGGVGIAPGANIGKNIALFEAVHGSAPKYAGLDKVNPSSLILSGVMMLNHIGWNKAAFIIEQAIEKTIKSKIVTYDFARNVDGAEEVKCSEFTEEIVKNIG